MKNFIQPGDVLTVTAPYDVDSGDGCLVGSLFGVAAYDADSAGTVDLVTEGVFDLAKTTSQAWTVGQLMYWDNSGKKVTSTSSSNKLIGVCAKAAGTNDTTGHVMLTGAFSI